MRVLAIETSSPVGSIAAVDGGEVKAQEVVERPGGYGEVLHEVLSGVLRRSGWTLGDFQLLAVGVGPGSFTGLRVGLAFAHGLAQGTSTPLVGVCSLRAMALAAPAHLAEVRCAVLDARRDELFVAAFDRSGRQVLPARALACSTASSLLTQAVGSNCLYVGSAASMLEGNALRHQSKETDFPMAASVALQASAGCHVPPLPNYVRDQVADMPRLPPNPLGMKASL